MPGNISLHNLERMAAKPDVELRYDKAQPDKVLSRSGSWGGRLMRNLKIAFGADRTDRHEGYMDAKGIVRDSLIAHFGAEIGNKAFRAGIGRQGAGGTWTTSADHPIAGRHIATMLKVAKEEMYKQHDLLRMKQISIGGMAGPFSKGVCQAATTDWFRRIDKGLPTWQDASKAQPGPDELLPEAPPQRAGVDWERKRARLRDIQAQGQRRDPAGRFANAGTIYERGTGIYSDQKSASGKALGQMTRELGAELKKSADQLLTADGPKDGFWQLDVKLAGHLYGSVGHTIGIHMTNPYVDTDGRIRPAMVHVFDANKSESVVPLDQFPAWLATHFEKRYGGRLLQVQMNEVERKDVNTLDQPQPGGDDFGVDDDEALSAPGQARDDDLLIPDDDDILMADDDEVSPRSPVSPPGNRINLGPDGKVTIVATMDTRRQKEFLDLTSRNLADPKPRSDDGLPPLAQQFWRDITRQTRVTVVHSATDTATLTAQAKPQAQLKKLVGGSDTAAYHLSKFLSQTPLNSMLGAISASLKDKDGRRVMPMPGTERTQGMTVMQGVDDNGEAVIDMSFAMQGDVSAVAVHGEALEAQAGSSRFTCGMRLQIRLADLQSGNVAAFRIVEPPTLQLRAQLKLPSGRAPMIDEQHS
jgi:hypothetical protein